MLINKGSHGSIRITVDGKEYGTYSLEKDQTIKINDTNVCEIKDGQARMISAQCPDHLCMKQKAIDEKGGTIVCLPNKVVIEGEKSTDSKKTDEPVIDGNLSFLRYLWPITISQFKQKQGKGTIDAAI